MARGLAMFLLVACVMAVLFAGLFPFDFSLPPGVGALQKIQRHSNRSPEPPLLEDRLVNVLFFVPFGFCVAGAIKAGRRARRNADFVAAAAGIAGGLALSGVVEIGQTFLGFRDPTWSDVGMNSLGSAMGAVIGIFLAGPAIERAAGQLLKLRRLATGPVIVAVAAGWAVLICAVPWLQRHRGSLDTWETVYPLLLGNERTRERPWRGAVRELVLAARAAQPNEIPRLAAGEAQQVFGEALLGWYELVGIGPFADRTGQLPELQWDGGPPEVQGTGQPALLSDDHWLRTDKAISQANRRIGESSQFTLAVACASSDLSLNGPGRIVSLSLNTGPRNLTIGQEGDHLAVRLRTRATGPGATAPQMEIPGVFLSEAERYIVVTYREPKLVVYVDGVENGHIEFTPEAVAIWRLYPRGMWRTRIDRGAVAAHAWVYRLMAFVPLGALTAAAAGATRRRSSITSWLVAAGAIAVVALALELIIGLLSQRAFSAGQLLFSMAAGFMTLAVIHYPRRGR
jgi:VanZ family protein